MPRPGRMATISRREIGWSLAMGVVGLGLRLAFAWQYVGEPLGRYPWVDEASYWTWAQTILKGEWWPVRPFYQDPLYPYWLGCLMGLVGTDIPTLRVISAGLGALTPLLVAWAGRMGLGRLEGVVAGWMLALYAPLVFSDGCLEKEGLATFWTAIGLLSIAYLARSGRLTHSALAGASWGVAGLLRSNSLLIAPLALGWIWLGGAGSRTGGWSDRRWLCVGFLAGFALIVLPVAAVNTAVSRPRELLGTTWQLGPNFYIGNGPEANGTYVAPPFVRAHPAYEPGDYASEAIRRSRRILSPGQISRFWLGEGLRQWLRAPVASLRLLAWKLALLVHRGEIPDNQDIEFVQLMAAPSLRWGIIHFGMILPLAVVGLARVPRTHFWWFLTLATSLGLAATALFFVVGRYRVPWVPVLVLLAAAGVVDLVRCARRGDWRGLSWRIVALALPATLLAWRPQADPVPSRWGNQLISLGVADLRAGQLDAAIDAFDLARATSAEMAERVQQIFAEEPVHGLMVERSASMMRSDRSSNSGPDDMVRRCHLNRQIPERRSEAASQLESLLRSEPKNSGARRELGALLLSWPERRDGRTRALGELTIAARSGGDVTASLLLALATSDPAHLKLASVALADTHDPRLALVQAILASRGKR